MKVTARGNRIGVPHGTHGRNGRGWTLRTSPRRFQRRTVQRSSERRKSLTRWRGFLRLVEDREPALQKYGLEHGNHIEHQNALAEYCDAAPGGDGRRRDGRRRTSQPEYSLLRWRSQGLSKSAFM